MNARSAAPVLKLRCRICGGDSGTVYAVRDYYSTHTVATAAHPAPQTSVTTLAEGHVAVVTTYPRGLRRLSPADRSFTMEYPLVDPAVPVYSYCKEHGALRAVTWSEMLAAIGDRKPKLLVDPRRADET